MALVLLSAALSVAIPVCGAYVVEKSGRTRLAERRYGST